MTTIKLKKPKPGAPQAEGRTPLRPTGVKRNHPTLAQAQAERAERRSTWSDRPPQREEIDPRRRSSAPPARPAFGQRPDRQRDQHDLRAAPVDPRRRAAPTADHRAPSIDPRRRAPADDRRPRSVNDHWQAPGDRQQRPQPGPNAPRGPRPPSADRRPGPAADRRPGAYEDRSARRPAPLQDHRQPPPRPAPPLAEPRRVDPSEPQRLSKRMSELGLASRREADEWISRGLVRVDGVIVDQLGARVSPTQRIEVDPEAHNEQSQRVTILLHKPLGIVSGQAEDGHAPAATLIGAASRWPGDHHQRQFHPSQLHHLVPAGRLDLDSTGLLVLTQDGRVAKTLIGADTKVEKEYVVHVAWPEQPDAKLNEVFPPEKLALLREGLLLDKQALKPAKVSWQNETHLRFVLREGKRRQIRRMCEEVGLQVLGLKRIRIGRVGLGEMAPGQWRYLGPFETFL